MSNILITGGAGFIGSPTAEVLAENNKVIIVDNLSTGCQENIPHNAEFINCDIADEESIQKIMKNVDYVIHLASIVSIEESYNDPERFFRTNYIGFMNVINSAVKNNVKKIVFSSSCSVYEEMPHEPKKESLCVYPTSPYALSKINAEYLLEIYNKKYNLSYLALRYFNVFGPGQNLKSSYGTVIPTFIRKSLNNEDLVILGDGNQQKDFIYIDDVVSANILSINSKVTGKFNIGYGEGIRIIDLAKKIIDLTCSESKIKYSDGRSGDVRYSVADISLSKAMLKWKINNNFDSA